MSTRALVRLESNFFNSKRRLALIFVEPILVELESMVLLDFLEHSV